MEQTIKSTGIALTGHALKIRYLDRGEYAFVLENENNSNISALFQLSINSASYFIQRCFSYHAMDEETPLINKIQTACNHYFSE
ncbi:MAG: hypothetical protein AAGI90_04100 [Chlamydiota bacterium]